MSFVAAVLALVLTVASSGAPIVTLPEFHKVHIGWTKRHVERVFDTHGHRAFAYADVSGLRHLAKNYPAAGSDTVRVLYVAPPSQPFRLQTKLWIP